MGRICSSILASAWLVVVFLAPSPAFAQDAAPSPPVAPLENIDPAPVPPAPTAVPEASPPAPLPPVAVDPGSPPPQTPPASIPRPVQPEPTVRLTFPNTSVNEILSLYEVLTDKRLVRDSMLAQGQPLTIVVPGEVPRSEAIRLIEASLLLNCYSFVPVDDKTVKILGP